jgi:hypothetical protein
MGQLALLIGFAIGLWSRFSSRDVPTASHQDNNNSKKTSAAAASTGTSGFLARLRDRREEIVVPNPFIPGAHLLGITDADLLATYAECKIPTAASIHWRKRIGDQIQLGDVVFEVKTDVVGSS